MPRKCCVSNCQSPKGTALHGFPQNAELFKTWCDAIGRPELYDTGGSENTRRVYGVCDIHFDCHAKFSTILKYGSIPTLHLPDAPALDDILPDAISADANQTKISIDLIVNESSTTQLILETDFEKSEKNVGQVSTGNGSKLASKICIKAVHRMPIDSGIYIPVCRICLTSINEGESIKISTEAASVVSILHEEQTRNIAVSDMLSLILPELQIGHNSKNVICQKCVLSLYSSYVFKTRWLETEKKLLEACLVRNNRSHNNSNLTAAAGQIIIAGDSVGGDNKKSPDLVDDKGGTTDLALAERNPGIEEACPEIHDSSSVVPSQELSSALPESDTLVTSRDLCPDIHESNSIVATRDLGSELRQSLVASPDLGSDNRELHTLVTSQDLGIHEESNSIVASPELPYIKDECLQIKDEYLEESEESLGIPDRLGGSLEESNASAQELAPEESLNSPGSNKPSSDTDEILRFLQDFVKLEPPANTAAPRKRPYTNDEESTDEGAVHHECTTKPCQDCGKNQKSTPPPNNNVHNNRKFQCTLCNKFLSSSYGLKKHHKVVHSKPNNDQEKSLHQCDQCAESFAYKTTLAQHMRAAHSKGKPDPNPNRTTVQCQVCGKELRDGRNHKKHMMIYHETTGGTRCHVCKKAFWSRKNLVRHLEVAHSDGGKDLVAMEAQQKTTDETEIEGDGLLLETDDDTTAAVLKTETEDSV